MGKRLWWVLGAVTVVAVAGAALYVAPRIKGWLPKVDNAAAVDSASEVIEGGDQLVLVPRDSNGALVVYLHGAQASYRAILNDPETSSLTAGLLDAGYTVASADAEGDAWGNAASVTDYGDLIDRTSAEYDLSATYLIGESMGGLAAAQLADREDVRAWVGIYPVCDPSTITEPDLVKSIAASGTTITGPLAWPNTPRMVWASYGDTLVPTAENAEACGGEFIETTGNHGDPSNFDGAAVVRFFDAN